MSVGEHDVAPGDVQPSLPARYAGRVALIIYGCGGHARVVADAAVSAGVEVVGWASDDVALTGRDVDGRPVIAIGLAACIQLARESGLEVVVGIGGNRVRQRLTRALLAGDVEVGTVIHARAVVAPNVDLGVGSVVMAGAVVNVGAAIGVGAILNTSCSVDHDARLGDFVHLSPGVHLGGTVTIGDGTHLGVGVAVRNNVAIGAWSIVGVGSAVVADLPDGVVAYGVPARAVRPSPDAEAGRSS